MLILGIESSCDETAASVVRDGREVISNIVFSQIDLHKIYGGVVPEIASRAHIEIISKIVKESISPIGEIKNIDGIAVTYAPGLIGALLVGVGFAKSLAYAINKPLIPVHHLRGHVASNYFIHKELKPPFTALIASGGHSHIVLVSDYTDYKILGQTRDDAAGESFDKTARVLGLGYPGGPKVQALAKTGNPEAINFPRVNFSENPYDFSFSGVKTAVINYIHNAVQAGTEINKADVAASFTKAVCDVLSQKAVLAASNTTKRLVVAGGVAANSFLRDALVKACNKQNIELYLPEIQFCGDNAAMIASQGYYEFLSGNIAYSDLNAYANMNISL
ncbi:MAG: gcp [Clostridia bacterium]|nr:gcp [Clostridia bacterium]